MDWTLEVVVLPVSDIDRAIAFYRDQVGFVLDHDTRTEHMHVAQLTPAGSGCSIVVGDLPAQTEMAPGSMRGLQLCVADAAAAREELLSRGVEASEISPGHGVGGKLVRNLVGHLRPPGHPATNASAAAARSS